MRRYPVFLRINRHDIRAPRFVLFGAALVAICLLAKGAGDVIADAGLAFAPQIVAAADRLESKLSIPIWPFISPEKISHSY